MSKLIISDQLELRPLQPADAPALFALVDSNRDYLGEYLPWVAGTTQVEDSRAFIDTCLKESAAGTDAHFGIFWNGALVGHLSLMRIEPALKGEIGYWLSREAGGQGIMTQAVRAVVDYAFNERKLVRVAICCRAGNARSAGVALRLGFSLEGVERLGELHHGQYFDLEYYGLLAPAKPAA